MEPTIYSAGWNMPGCLPDSDPFKTTSFEAAKQYIIDAILEAADEAANEELNDLADTLAGIVEDINLQPDAPFDALAGMYNYFVQETEPEDEDETRVLALIRHLDDGTDLDEVTASKYTENGLDVGTREYLVLTEEEATDLAEENIERDLWAFVPSFLIGYMPEGMDVETLQAISEKRCEDASPSFKALVGDKLQSLKDDAIACDGRGHMLNTYDGEEHESGDFFIYRTN